MTSLQGVAYLTEVCAAVSAVALARRSSHHAPAAVALVVLAAAGVLDAPIADALPPAADPWQGWHRVLVWLDGADNLATVAATTGLAVAIATSPERRSRAAAVVAGVWFAVSVALAALYPSPLVRGAGLQRIYLDADLIGLFTSTVALISWARAGIAAKRSPDSAFAVALSLVVLDVVILLTPYSPWRGSVFGASFDGVQLIIALSFATITVVQVIIWNLTAR